MVERGGSQGLLCFGEEIGEGINWECQWSGDVVKSKAHPFALSGRAFGRVWLTWPSIHNPGASKEFYAESFSSLCLVDLKQSRPTILQCRDRRLIWLNALMFPEVILRVCS